MQPHCIAGHEVALVHSPRNDSAHKGEIGYCDGGGNGGCFKVLDADKAYYHCDICQADLCQTCVVKKVLV